MDDAPTLCCLHKLPPWLYVSMTCMAGSLVTRNCHLLSTHPNKASIMRFSSHGDLLHAMGSGVILNRYVTDERRHLTDPLAFKLQHRTATRKKYLASSYNALEHTHVMVGCTKATAGCSPQPDHYDDQLAGTTAEQRLHHGLHQHFPGLPVTLKFPGLWPGMLA